ncbi:Mfs1.2 [Trametopsis cervina]|nr:Mfs1.2 [Trametopsis cervina]
MSEVNVSRVASTLHEPEVNPANTRATSQPQSPRGVRFWLIIFAICISCFLSALEYTAVSTALPTILNDLHGDDFVWVASAYALASTALLPASGGLAQIFGRRPLMLISLAIFALGSALCGSAQNMNWLIAARTIQGAGGGGILSLTSIILSDLVTLQERAIYNALIGLTWAVACAIGPLVGGALTEAGQWRWLFYLNLPVCGVAGLFVLLFLKLKTPEGSLREKLSRMDWIGNGIITASSSACVLALTWGGVQFPWSSGHVLAPLIIGLCGIGFFFFYEAKFAKEPLVPFQLISNRTSLSGYIQTFLAPVVMASVIYYLPIYAQACRGAGPLRSGVDVLGLSASTAPVLMLTGVSIALFKAYRPQLWLGWAMYMIGMGALTQLDANANEGMLIGLPVLIGVGVGTLLSGTYFPVLAPLPVTENAHALAFFAFCRSFANVWGVTVGTAVLQTQLAKRLPTSFTDQFPQGVAIAYQIIPVIPHIDEPARTGVREAFADSLIVLWQVMIGVAGLGLIASLFMKALPLHTQMDDQWALNEAEEKEKGSVQGSVVEASNEV